MSVNDYSGLGPGQGHKAVTVAATPEVLSTTTPACRDVTVTALPANTGIIAVGFDNGVLATAGSEKGILLSAGQSVSLPIQNAGNIWIDASVNGEGVSFSWK